MNFPPKQSKVKNKKQELNSGYRKYTLTPKTDISVELREGLEADKLFISGSCMRGRVRANLEILSKSYPQFVNTTPMLYRDVTNNMGLGGAYKKRLCKQEQAIIDIEKHINVGFLRKDVNDFYVVLAEEFLMERDLCQ